jgi:ketosteroid isomerase-like protein
MSTPVSERLREAVENKDVDAFVDCFQENYRSEQPCHPARGFGGREQVRKNWSAIMREVPNVRFEVLSRAFEGDTEWVECRTHGTRVDGSALEMRGVIIQGIDDERIAWARLYLADVERDGADIDQAVAEMTGRNVEDG